MRGRRDSCLPDTIERCRRLQPVVAAESRDVVRALRKCRRDRAGDPSRAGASETTARSHVDPIEGISGLLFADHQRGQSDRVAYGSPYVTDRIGASDRRGALTHHVRIVLSRQSISAAGARQPRDRAGAGGNGHRPVRRRRTVRRSACGAGAAGKSSLSKATARARAISTRMRRRMGAAVHVRHLSVESYLQRRDVQRPDTLVIDPPRTGMSREAMSGILGLKVPRVVYVSCDPATLARDVKRFCGSRIPPRPHRSLRSVPEHRACGDAGGADR